MIVNWSADSTRPTCHFLVKSRLNIPTAAFASFVSGSIQHKSLLLLTASSYQVCRHITAWCNHCFKSQSCSLNYSFGCVYSLKMYIDQKTAVHQSSIFSFYISLSQQLQVWKWPAKEISTDLQHHILLTYTMQLLFLFLLQNKRKAVCYILL